MHRNGSDRRTGTRHGGRARPGAPISVPVGEETLGRIFNVTGDPIDNKAGTGGREEDADSSGSTVI